MKILKNLPLRIELDGAIDPNVDVLYSDDTYFAACITRDEAEYIVQASNLFPEMKEMLEEVIHDPCFNANCDEELWNKIKELLNKL